MNMKDLQCEVEDKAVEYLNEMRLESLEQSALAQLDRSANNGYIRLHKLEFLALVNAVRGLQRKRQSLETALNISVELELAEDLRKLAK